MEGWCFVALSGLANCFFFGQHGIWSGLVCCFCHWPSFELWWIPAGWIMRCSFIGGPHPPDGRVVSGYFTTWVGFGQAKKMHFLAQPNLTRHLIRSSIQYCSGTDHSVELHWIGRTEVHMDFTQNSTFNLASSEEAWIALKTMKWTLVRDETEWIYAPTLT